MVGHVAPDRLGEGRAVEVGQLCQRRGIRAEGHRVAAEAAHAIGANPQYARSTVAFIEAQMRVNADGPELTPAALDEALAVKFSSDAQAVGQSAADLLDKMPDAGREWLNKALRGIDAQSAAVVVERLARTASANAPKA